jgi:hypothetical protein
MRPVRRAVTIGLALGTALALAGTSAPTAGAAPELIRLGVSFGSGARLGASTPMTLDLRISPALPPVEEVRILTPPGISLIDSGLGAIECRRPQIEVDRVMGPIRHGRCPANSLIGSGVATAGLLLNEEETLFGAAHVELHAGSPVADKPGLLVTADTYNPVRLQLTYAGYLYVPPPAFGLGLTIKIPQIPRPPFGAPVALASLHLVVGRPSLTYLRTEGTRRVGYHPAGIPLPARCPAEGFRFRTIMRFARTPGLDAALADRRRLQADHTVRCPSAGVQR